MADLPLLTVALQEHRVGVPARDVQEVVRAVAIAPLPEAPQMVEGVINLRGRIVPVLDMRPRFRLESTPLHPDQHFVIVLAGGRTVALRVDRALDLIMLPQGAIESGDPVTLGAKRVAGIAKLADGVLVIYDLQRFLSLAEGEALDAALHRAATERTAATPKRKR